MGKYTKLLFEAITFAEVLITGQRVLANEKNKSS